MTQLFECVDGPYRGYIVSMDDNENRVQVRDLAGKLQPEWYEVDPSNGGVSLSWAPPERSRSLLHSAEPVRLSS